MCFQTLREMLSMHQLASRQQSKVTVVFCILWLKGLRSSKMQPSVATPQSWGGLVCLTFAWLHVAHCLEMTFCRGGNRPREEE